jgi:ABC-2 type transport system permease protein
MPIFDQGYQHWKGKLSGHAWRWLTIARRGVRTQLKGRILRLLLLVAWLPAVALVIVLALWGLFEQGTEGVLGIVQSILPPGIAADPHVYRRAVWTLCYSFFFRFETFFIMLLVLTAGPGLISRDLRFNALPLYFSRPLTRRDYFLGKLGVIAALVAAVAVEPAVAAYLLGVAFSLDLSVVRDTWRLLPASIVYGLVVVLSAGTAMLALSSLSRRSLYVGIAWVGLWLVGSTMEGVLEGIHRATMFHAAWEEENSGRSTDGQTPAPDEAGAKRSSRGRQAGSGAWQRVQQDVERRQAETAPRDWRPICSYTANLERLGDALLNTDAAWVEIGRAVEAPRATMQSFLGVGAKPQPVNERRLADQFVPQYPWIWSAGVLAGLMGISLWILSMRVKSLDRLR